MQLKNLRRTKNIMRGPWQFLIQIINCIFKFLQSLWIKATAPTIDFDNGRSVKIGPKIAEGGFSFVFEAYDQEGTKYALKRIHVVREIDMLQACLREAGIHRSLRHACLMPILGLAQERKSPSVVVYMLFPFMPQSLRAVVNEAIFPVESNLTRKSRPAFRELQLLQLFHQIMSGVSAMHDAGYSHRDIKLENILLDSHGNPVLTDFGSAGPLEESVTSRSQLLTILDVASQHTTLPYRAPELLEAGGLRASLDDDVTIDFGKVDVWSLGCTLFAMCYGASPFECEFRNQGTIKIVECTPLRILGRLPSGPPTWFSQGLWDSFQLLLTQERNSRPTLDEAMVEIEALIQKQGGRIPQSGTKPFTTTSIGKVIREDDDSDLDALLRTNRFV
jgi:serine/threonine kinase 16